MIACDRGISLDDPESCLELSQRGFGRLAEFITGELGIKMPDGKLTMVQSRLLRRVRELRLRSVDEYADYVLAAAQGSEREHLVNAITTNKTDFFRESDHFSYLTKTVIPALTGLNSRQRSRFRVWSAGCSSGEEPYTLAMVMNEYAKAQQGFDFAILATDISTRVLDRACNGIYEESQIAPVPMELRRKYLLSSRNRKEPLARIIPELRKKVTFHQLNFMAGDYGIQDSFDAVFFRNVMIYFDRATQAAVIRKICRNLATGGYLFAGHSESLAGLDVPLRSVKASIYRKID